MGKIFSWIRQKFAISYNRSNTVKTSLVWHLQIQPVLIMPTAHVWFISMTMSEFRGGKLEASRLLSFGKIKQLGTSPYHNQHNEPLCRRVLSTTPVEVDWTLVALDMNQYLSLNNALNFSYTSIPGRWCIILTLTKSKIVFQFHFHLSFGKKRGAFGLVSKHTIDIVAKTS